MITFENDFFNFVENFESKINEIFPDFKRNFKFYTKDESSITDVQESPFGTNPKSQYNGNYHIAYNENLIKKYNLSMDEIWASICHEIGHHLYTPKREDSDIEKEIFCDSVAVNLDLKESMLSAVIKLKELMSKELYENRIKALS